MYTHTHIPTFLDFLPIQAPSWIKQSSCNVHNSTSYNITTARTLKQPNCPSIEELIKNMWYINTMEYYSLNGTHFPQIFTGCPPHFNSGLYEKFTSSESKKNNEHVIFKMKQVSTGDWLTFPESATWERVLSWSPSPQKACPFLGESSHYNEEIGSPKNMALWVLRTDGVSSQIPVLKS